MKYPIQSISIKLRENESNTIIPINGKNIIVVGDNGAGKTKFLSKLHDWLDRFYSHHEAYSIQNIEKLVEQAKVQRSYHEVNSKSYIEWDNQLNKELAKLKELQDFNIDFSNADLLKSEILKSRLLLKFLPAYRKYESSQGSHLTSIESLFEIYESQTSHHINASSLFETFLVSMSNYALLQKGSDNFDEYARVNILIRDIESDVRSLLESDNLKIKYNLSSLRMEIQQENRDLMSFEKLPSGFSSILAVYSELIMHAELRKVKKSSLDGIVIIDEIDAHLHVTLQKKVFEFFSKSFPNIQFIISTHSPFVVQSVSDAVIFNISTKEVMEDLSLYSYTSIISGLLGETTSSEELESLLRELDILARNNDFSERFHQISCKLNEHVEKLDGKSKTIFMMAQNKLVDWEEKE